jgi:hypothetical protein
MRPKFPQTVEITTPGPPTEDPVSGSEIPGTPTVETARARISQAPVANVGSQVELLAQQNTVISLWTVIVPPGTVMTSQSTLVDDQGRRFQVTGDVADRPNHRPQFRAAAARLISDQQE